MDADEEVVDVDKIMAEFDKESNTRNFTGIFQKIIKGAMVLFSLYVMFDGWTGTMEERQDQGDGMYQCIRNGYR